MTPDEFVAHIGTHDSPPQGLPQTLAALWWDPKGDWNRTHAIRVNARRTSFSCSRACS